MCRQHAMYKWKGQKESKEATSEGLIMNKEYELLEYEHQLPFFFWGTLFLRKLYLKNFNIKNKNKISQERGKLTCKRGLLFNCYTEHLHTSTENAKLKKSY